MLKRRWNLTTWGRSFGGGAAGTYLSVQKPLIQLLSVFSFFSSKVRKAPDIKAPKRIKDREDDAKL